MDDQANAEAVKDQRDEHRDPMAPLPPRDDPMAPLPPRDSAERQPSLSAGRQSKRDRLAGKAPVSVVIVDRDSFTPNIFNPPPVQSTFCRETSSSRTLAGRVASAATDSAVRAAAERRQAQEARVRSLPTSAETVALDVYSSFKDPKPTVPNSWTRGPAHDVEGWMVPRTGGRVLVHYRKKKMSQEEAAAQKQLCDRLSKNKRPK